MKELIYDTFQILWFQEIKTDAASLASFERVRSHSRSASSTDSRSSSSSSNTSNTSNRSGQTFIPAKERFDNSANRTTGQLIGVVGLVEDTSWLVSLLENLLYSKDNNRGNSRKSECDAVSERCEVVVRTLVDALLELESIPNLTSSARIEDQSIFLQDLRIFYRDRFRNYYSF